MRVQEIGPVFLWFIVARFALHRIYFLKKGGDIFPISCKESPYKSRAGKNAGSVLQLFQRSIALLLITQTLYRNSTSLPEASTYSPNTEEPRYRRSTTVISR